MSIDSPSNSQSLSPCEVISKYFPCKVMDDSLSEFKEKKNFTAPKQKQVINKPKPKKRIKKIKGQKDIRSVLKKNELVAYSTDFDKVCKKSGIDVDSEQLQLAIALSKSLQQSENKDEDSSPSTSSQDRIGKIRTTLQEYGFVVPEVKINAPKRRVKKFRKNYKLIQTTEAEKQEVIANRYSKVLFSNLDSNKTTDNSNLINPAAKLYHIATNITYEEIKDNNLLYIEDLIEKVPSCVGCLLRNWSEIPGRPVSPTFETINIDFSCIDCSQDELDTVLSGEVKCSQEIVRHKFNLLSQATANNPVDNTSVSSTEMDNKVEKIPTINKNNDGKEKAIEIIDLDDNYLTVQHNIRSYSPDMFDDEVSTIIEDGNSLMPKSQEIPINNKTTDHSVVMDLTECVVLNSQRCGTNSQLSQDIDATRRRSNDFMDMTKCVVGSSQPIRENVIMEEKVDLTQNSDDETKEALTDNEKVKDINTDTKPNDVQSLDLTQSSESSEELPFVKISGSKSLDETILLNDEEYVGLIANKSSCNTTLDDQGDNSVNVCDKLPKPICIESEDEEERTVCNHANRAISPIQHITDRANISPGPYLEVRALSPIEDIPSDKINISSEQVNDSIEEICDLDTEFKRPAEDTVKSKTDSFFDEFVYHHSDSSKENVDDCDMHDSSDKEEEIAGGSKDVIDISQESSSDESYHSNKMNSPKKFQSSTTSSLGKLGNVSIDYDELFDDMMKKHCSGSQLKITNRSNSADFSECPKTDPNSDLVSNSSQNSEVFEISDNELNYSLQKSKLDDNKKENFDIGGISVMDNLSDFASLRQSDSNSRFRSLNRSLSDSFMPMTDVRNTNSPIKSTAVSPTKLVKELIAKTPKNGEYIIKTDQVTPMQNYDAMSTPEMNRELDKYGLKPFKRKRAIQLLTHLYNQTHPIVESCSDNLPSPSKKRKTNPQNSSPNKRKSPMKKPAQKNIASSSSAKEINLEVEDCDIYTFVNEVPVIRDIACLEEDWVFQKREKAKLHSCRVPLHIAFHNFVSSRPRLREAILRYEPVNIDLIHKGLATEGHKYDPKDLLKFMDKKCITVKTADNNGRNKKHY